MKTDWKSAIPFLLFPLAVGLLAGAITSGSANQYADLVKPPLSPPGWVFPLVWTVLYLLMGWASYRVYASDTDAGTKKRGLILYLIQLAVNFLWPILFFSFGLYFLSFLWILLLLVLTVLTAVPFYSLDDKAGDALLPYILWLLFAAYLNYGIFLLNR